MEVYEQKYMTPALLPEVVEESIDRVNRLAYDLRVLANAPVRYPTLRKRALEVRSELIGELAEAAKVYREPVTKPEEPKHQPKQPSAWAKELHELEVEAGKDREWDEERRMAQSRVMRESWAKRKSLPVQPKEHPALAGFSISVRTAVGGGLLSLEDALLLKDRDPKEQFRVFARVMDGEAPNIQASLEMEA